MTKPALTHHVFVDFENVPNVDLRLVAGKPVHITLLIGKNQGKMNFELVEQIHRLAGQVALVKLESSGRNALDITLSYYLGRSVQQFPEADFCIVSKDKDFEPMLEHLKSKGLKAKRYDSLTMLPFLPKPKKPAAQKPGTQPELPLHGLDGDHSDRLNKFIIRLQKNSAPRPKKKSSLLAHISTVFGGKLPVVEQELKLVELIQRGVLLIDAKDRVSYLTPT